MILTLEEPPKIEVIWDLLGYLVDSGAEFVANAGRTQAAVSTVRTDDLDMENSMVNWSQRVLSGLLVAITAGSMAFLDSQSSWRTGA